MKPCIRCGRWIDTKERERIQESTFRPKEDIPLNFLKNFPVAVSAWNNLQFNKQQSKNQIDLTSSSGVVMTTQPQQQQQHTRSSSSSTTTATRSRNNHILNSPQTALNEKQRRLLLQNTDYLFCNLPDCMDPVTKSKTDVNHACQPEKWEFAVPCQDCGRVWPLPIPHPSSYTCSKTQNYYLKDDPKRFVCASYPMLWKQAVLNNENRKKSSDNNNKNDENGQNQLPAPTPPVCPSLVLEPVVVTSTATRKNKDSNSKNNTLLDNEGGPPSVSSTQPLAVASSPPQRNTQELGLAPPLSTSRKRTAATTTTASSKKQQTSSSVYDKEPTVSVEMAVRSFVLPPPPTNPSGSSDQVPTLRFMKDCLPPSEKLKDTTKRSREITSMTKLRLEAAQLQYPIPDTPMFNRSVSRADNRKGKKGTSSKMNNKQEEKMNNNSNNTLDNESQDDFLIMSQQSPNSSSSATALIPLNSTQPEDNNNANASGTILREQVEKQRAFERLQHLSFAMRSVSTVAARSGFVGVNDPSLDEWCDPNEVGIKNKGGSSSTQQMMMLAMPNAATDTNNNSDVVKQEAPTTKKVSGKRRGRNEPTDEEGAAVVKVQEGNNNTTDQKAPKNDAAVVVVVKEDENIIYELGSEEIHWARCLKCNKWRVLGVEHIEEFKIPEKFMPAAKNSTSSSSEGTVKKEDTSGADEQHQEEDPLDLFECAMLPDGTNCATKNEANYQKPGLLALKRRRAAFMNTRSGTLLRSKK